MARICLIGTDSFSMLYPTSSTTPIGGEAVQQILLARAFKSLGYSVSMIIRAVEEDIDEMVDGIRVVSAFKLGGGLPVVRFFHPRATGLFSAMSEVDADVYYQSPAAGLTGLAAAFCRWRSKKFICRVASDVDCMPGDQLIRLWRDRKLYEYGLRSADLIAVQSRYQQELLIRNYGLESAVVNMAMELPTEEMDGERDIDVLWISNIKTVKRPDRILAIARRLNNVSFTMIGGMNEGEKDYYAEIERKAALLPNVQFLGRVPYNEVNQYVARTKIFLNTSDVEGFPNTFLQAWARKVPIISFFDPDNIIARVGLGRCPGSDDEMCEAIFELLEDKQAREDIGAAAHSFAVENYSPTAAARRYAELCEL